VNEGPIGREAGEDEVARRLVAYSRARLTPAPEVSARLRISLLRAAASLGRSAASRPIRRRAFGRWAAALLAASLVVAFGVGATTAAPPGSPLYEARLWLEALTLPAGGDGRTDAIVDRLGSRIAETEAAAARGDEAAVAAALAAYRAEVGDALTSAATDADRLARLEAALGHHLEVLAALTEQVPTQARSAIEHAIERSSNAVDQINDTQAGGPDASHGPAGGASDHPGGSPEDDQ